MKPEEQRIAIAEACGWEKKITTRGSHKFLLFRKPGGSWVSTKFLPDYLTDLNAMQCAILTLPST